MGPGGAGCFEAEAAVVEGVIDGDEVGAVGEDVAGEALGAGLGVFATDGGDDDVDNGTGEALFECGQEKMGVGVESIDGGCGEVAGGDAVAVADDVDGAVFGPVLAEEGGDVGEVESRRWDGHGSTSSSGGLGQGG